MVKGYSTNLFRVHFLFTATTLEESSSDKDRMELVGSKKASLTPFPAKKNMGLLMYALKSIGTFIWVCKLLDVIVITPLYVSTRVVIKTVVIFPPVMIGYLVGFLELCKVGGYN